MSVLALLLVLVTFVGRPTWSGFASTTVFAQTQRQPTPFFMTAASVADAPVGHMIFPGPIADLMWHFYHRAEQRYIFEKKPPPDWPLVADTTSNDRFRALAPELQRMVFRHYNVEYQQRVIAEATPVLLEDKLYDTDDADIELQTLSLVKKCPDMTLETLHILEGMALSVNTQVDHVVYSIGDGRIRSIWLLRDAIAYRKMMDALQLQGAKEAWTPAQFSEAYAEAVAPLNRLVSTEWRIRRLYAVPWDKDDKSFRERENLLQSFTALPINDQMAVLRRYDRYILSTVEDEADDGTSIVWGTALQISQLLHDAFGRHRLQGRLEDYFHAWRALTSNQIESMFAKTPDVLLLNPPLTYAERLHLQTAHLDHLFELNEDAPPGFISEQTMPPYGKTYEAFLRLDDLAMVAQMPHCPAWCLALVPLFRKMVTFPTRSEESFEKGKDVAAAAEALKVGLQQMIEEFDPERDYLPLNILVDSWEERFDVLFPTVPGEERLRISFLRSLLNEAALLAVINPTKQADRHAARLPLFDVLVATFRLLLEKPSLDEMEAHITKHFLPFLKEKEVLLDLRRALERRAVHYGYWQPSIHYLIEAVSALEEAHHITPVSSKAELQFFLHSAYTLRKAAVDPPELPQLPFGMEAMDMFASTVAWRALVLRIPVLRQSFAPLRGDDAGTKLDTAMFSLWSVAAAATQQRDELGFAEAYPRIIVRIVMQTLSLLGREIEDDFCMILAYHIAKHQISDVNLSLPHVEAAMLEQSKWHADPHLFWQSANKVLHAFRQALYWANLQLPPMCSDLSESQQRQRLPPLDTRHPEAAVSEPSSGIASEPSTPPASMHIYSLPDVTSPLLTAMKDRLRPRI